MVQVKANLTQVLSDAANAAVVDITASLQNMTDEVK
jgi:hypothetical protein